MTTDHHIESDAGEPHRVRLADTSDLLSRIAEHCRESGRAFTLRFNDLRNDYEAVWRDAPDMNTLHDTDRIQLTSDADPIEAAFDALEVEKLPW